MTLNVKGDCKKSLANVIANMYVAQSWLSIRGKEEWEKGRNEKRKREKKHVVADVSLGTTAVRRNGQNSGLKPRRLLPTRSNHRCFFLHLGLIGFRALAKSRNIPLFLIFLENKLRVGLSEGIFFVPPKVGTTSKRESRSFKKHEKSVDDINDNNNENKAERGARESEEGKAREPKRHRVRRGEKRKKRKRREGKKSRGETKAMINSTLDVQDH